MVAFGAPGMSKQLRYSKLAEIFSRDMIIPLSIPVSQLYTSTNSTDPLAPHLRPVYSSTLVLYCSCS